MPSLRGHRDSLRAADDSLKIQNIHSVPRQEERRSMLALGPLSSHRRMERVNPVNRRLVSSQLIGSVIGSNFIVATA